MGARALLTAAAVLAAGVAAEPARSETGRTASRDPPPVRWRVGTGLEPLARSLARDSALFAPLPGIGDPAALFPDTVTIYLVRDLDSLAAPGSVVREEWVAGFADHRRLTIGVRAREAESGVGSIRSVLRHELAHLALNRATGGRAPRWLHEGYAQLATGDWDWRQAWRLRAELLKEGGDVLHNLSLGFAGRETEARSAYLLSYTAVHELWRRGGDAALGNFFAEMRRGADVDAALRSVYGLTVSQFEEQWKSSVTDRYGWLYVLSRASVFWVVLTVAVLLLGIRRWRYQKKRWEELRAQDAREGWDRVEWGDLWEVDPREEGEPEG